MQTTNFDVLIIGGGAAGFFAAIACAEANPNLKIGILERGKEVLNKVRISGGGRCNVTHACFEPSELAKNYPRGGRELLGAFHRFACSDTVKWFESRGVKLKIEDDGRMFPISNMSQSIINCLEHSTQKLGINVQIGIRVDKMQLVGEHWQLQTTHHGNFFAKKIMVAAGSSTAVWDSLKTLGHRIIEPVPSLFTFNIKDARLENLLGLSVPKAKIKVAGVKNLSSEGPLLITHWGLSGPAILRLSAWGARILAEKKYQFTIIVDWLNEDDVTEKLAQIKEKSPKKLVFSNPQFALPSRLWEKLVAAANISPTLRWVDLNKQLSQNLYQQLTQSEFKATGKSVFKEEFVTAGGVDLKEIDFRTFGSKIHPNLFFAGEILDIDAVTGGFNFQAAWTGGWIAGQEMAKM